MSSQSFAAVITGAGRGIGAEIARTFAAAGANLALLARTPDQLERTAHDCRQHGGSVFAIPADVARDDDVRDAIAKSVEQFGGVDVLVNCAAVLGPVGRFETNNVLDWWRTLEINLGGVVRCSHAVIPHMKRRGRGRIINLSGGGATQARPHLSAYSASKAAVVRFTETLAEELRGENILVNAVAPGMVNTTLHDGLVASADVAGSQAEDVLHKRATGEGWVPARLVAELVLFLASPAADGLTGKLISAPHDPWREWAGQGASLSASPMYTLRRLDAFTVRQVRDLT